MDPRHPRAPAGRHPAAGVVERLQQLEPGRRDRGRDPPAGHGLAQDKHLRVWATSSRAPSIERVLTTVDRLNARGGRDRRVRIHAIGFPTLFGLGGSDENTTVRFAMLMRALCERNGGTFVGLNSTSP